MANIEPSQCFGTMTQAAQITSKTAESIADSTVSQKTTDIIYLQDCMLR